jgi:hypothetical protein
LPAEPWEYGHAQEQVERLEKRPNAIEWHVGIKRQADFFPKAFDVVGQWYRIGMDLQMKNESIRPGFHKPLDELLGIRDHQVNFKRFTRDGTEPFHHDRPHAQIWYEVTIHDVDVDTIRAGIIHFSNEFPQAREIRG